MNRPVETPVVQAHEAREDRSLTIGKPRPTAGKLHIEPTADGRWAVRYEHRGRTLSDHLTANEAKYFAKQRARSEGIVGIVVHDAYLNVHEIAHFC
jgi:hypothetical protein